MRGTIISHIAARLVIRFFPALFFLLWMMLWPLINIARGVPLGVSFQLLWLWPSFLTWTLTGLFFTALIWVERIIVKVYRPRQALASDRWTLPTALLSITSGILLLWVHYAFASGQMVIGTIPWRNINGTPIPGGGLIPGQLFYQGIVDMWTYAGITAVVAGAVSISLVVKPRVPVAAGVILALAVAFLLTFAGMFSLNGSGLMITPAYFYWFPTVAIGLMIGALVFLLGFGTRRGLPS